MFSGISADSNSLIPTRYQPIKSFGFYRPNPEYWQRQNENPNCGRGIPVIQ